MKKKADIVALCNDCIELTTKLTNEVQTLGSERTTINIPAEVERQLRHNAWRATLPYILMAVCPTVGFIIALVLALVL